MEIKNIVIENYGGIKSLKLPDLKFLALVGPNGSGKSTTIDAIRFLLTGKTRYGVYKGQREGSVSASIVGVPLECKITDNGTTNVTNLASVTVAIPFVTYYTGSSNPTSSTGSNGDIYLKVVN